MAKHSKHKRGEQEVARILADILNTTARRGQQYAGSAESPDVLVNGFDVQIEVKRCERLSMYAALEQAENDAQGKRPAAVLHRRDRRPWLFMCRVDDLADIAEQIVALTGDHVGIMPSERKNVRKSGKSGGFRPKTSAQVDH